MSAVNWKSNAMLKLKAHPAVDEVEDEGMDEGRFFVHLKCGLDWNVEQEVRQSLSFSSAVKALKVLGGIKKTEAA